MDFLLQLRAWEWFLISFLLHMPSLMVAFRKTPVEAGKFLRFILFVISLLAAGTLVVGVVAWGQELEQHNAAAVEARRYDPTTYGH